AHALGVRRRAGDVEGGRRTQALLRVEMVLYCKAEVETQTVGQLQLLPLTAERASASGVVGNGDPATCTDQAFTTALSGGWLVTFNCGPDLKIITLTSVIGLGKIISTNTTVDGGNRVALSGANASR